MISKTSFNKVLVANRGEIAARVIRTAKAQGYRTVAVFSEADREAPHVQAADEAVCIGPAAVGESYLCADKILAAATKTGADAVHPGYGFLSENAEFSQAAEKAGIVFIGPTAAAIELMGSKRQSKIAMIEAGVPCIPGYEGADQSDDVLKKAALEIGMPVMLKASAGGGGRGMRLVTDADTLDEHIRSARSEAQNAFGSGELIIEKAVMQPRHIEIQVFADTFGNTIYLGERDCSVQRRHQKVVEEAPSPFVDEDLRKTMGEAAVAAAKSCNYRGAGTVEFLVDSEKNFYFLEMNTRLQVEHPVTELITGLDLVALQLQVAAGEPLGLTQDDIKLNGHAMEVRLYAEDPANNFVPQTGELLLWNPADAEDGLRIDSGIKQGQTVTPHYDPMLAKLISFGDNREQSRRRLVRLVEDSSLLGIQDNRAFLADCLKHPEFIAGEATTAFIAEHMEASDCMQPLKAQPEDIALAALILNAPDGFHNNALGIRFGKIAHNDDVVEVEIQQDRADRGLINVKLVATEESFSLRTISRDSHQLRFELDGIQKTISFVQSAENECWIDTTRGNLFLRDVTLISASAQAGGSDQVRASMDGAMIAVLVEAGQQVEQGQTLAVLEAMKMEHPLKAGVSGTVKEVLVNEGDQVKGRQLLIQLEEADA